MRVRIWPLVAVGFAVLLSLVPLFVWLVARKAHEIEVRTKAARQLYQQADDAITGIRASVYQGVPAADITKRLQTLSLLLDNTEHAKLTTLRNALDRYWKSQDRLAEILSIAEEIDAINEANLALEEQEIGKQQNAVLRFAAGATTVFVAIGLVLAIGITAYLAKLERVSERAEHELRSLSNQLVRAQEDERKTISRELHDEVGQILTGLRMELGSLTSSKADGSFPRRLESVKRLAEDALRAVRNLSLLLRPSMLDDLGLEPALRWQVKEFSKRSGMQVSLDIQGVTESLPEPVRMCLYRSIQEALTNCMKHSQAGRVTVAVNQSQDLVKASVQDNGVGFNTHQVRSAGLGLVGMEERIRALNGTLSVSSSPAKGTVVSLALPLMPEKNEPRSG
jgi:signal transduction histidine kinase